MRASDIRLDARVGRLGKQRLDGRHRVVLGHRVRHEPLQIMRDREAPEIARHHQRDLLPSEDQQQPGYQGPRDQRAYQREHGAIHGEPQRQQPEVGEQLQERAADTAARTPA